MKLINIFVTLLFILINVNFVSADTTVVKNIPDTQTNTIYDYQLDAISTQFISSSSDSIKRIRIKFDIPSNGSNQSALKLQFDNNVSYLVRTNKYFSISFQCIGYCIDINEILYVSLNGTNYQPLLNKTKTYNYITTGSIAIDYNYDTVSGNTTIFMGHGSSDVIANVNQAFGINSTNVDFSTHLNIGLPSQNVLISTLSPFNGNTFVGVNEFGMSGTTVHIYVQDGAGFNTIVLLKQQLSTISGILYAIVTLHLKIDLFGIDIQLLPDSEALLKIFLIFDTLFDIIYFIFALIFTYPYLILIWAITFGNIFVAWSSTSLREIIFNYRDYFMFVIKTSIGTLKYLYNIIVRIITAITNMIP